MPGQKHDPCHNIDIFYCADYVGTSKEYVFSQFGYKVGQTLEYWA